jgi:low affinity Fe/Cu permease
MKKMKKQNVLLQNTIEENRLSAEHSNTIIYDTLYEEINILSKRIDDEINHRQNSITSTQNNIETLERKTDSRLDKLHDMIKNQIK